MPQINWRAKAMYLAIAIALAIGLVPGLAASTASASVDGAGYGSHSSLNAFIAASRTSAPINGTIGLVGVAEAGYIGVTPDTWAWDLQGGVTSDVISGVGPIGGVTAYWTTSGIKCVTLTVTSGAFTAHGYIEVTIGGYGLEPPLAHDVLGTYFTFTVPAAETGTVRQWRVEAEDPLTVTTYSGGGAGDRSITLHCSALDPAYEGAACYVYADITGGPTYEGVKKWGKIDYTFLMPMVPLYSGYVGDYQDNRVVTGQTMVPAATLSSPITWSENNKQWYGSFWMTEVVVGSYNTNAGLLEVPASGAEVTWWLLDGSANVSTIPASGDFATVSGAIDALAQHYGAKHVTFAGDGIKTTTTSGEFGTEGITGVSVVASGEESVYVISVANYPGNLSSGNQYPVSAEIGTWNFWTQQVEKVPQVKWVEEKIVLEKYWGENYSGDLVHYAISDGEGTLESVDLNNIDVAYWANANLVNNANSVWTTVGTDGRSRCILTSPKANEVHVTTSLYSYTINENMNLTVINQHEFVVYFLKLFSVTLGNVQGERLANGLWGNLEVQGLVTGATGTSVSDSTKNWTPDEWIGKVVTIWKVNMGTQAATQERTVTGNSATDLTVDHAWDETPVVGGADVWYYSITSLVWNAGLDDTQQTLNISQDALLRARVQGYFYGDQMSGRPGKYIDLDPTAETGTYDAHGNLVYDNDPTNDSDLWLPAGYWVLPDDWARLAGPKWQELRPHWDIMDQPNDNIMSDADDGVMDKLGSYVGWGVNPINGLDMIEYPVAQWPVIGPYSTLDNYTPYKDLLWRKTIVPNGLLNWWDAPMPPAKIAFEIMGLTDIGYFKEVDKGDVYYQWVDTNANTPGPDAIAYTDPYYAEMIPSHYLIPPFANNMGYDWDSWSWTSDYGPYPFWEIVDRIPYAPYTGGAMTVDDPQHSTKVWVYSDNHGEAMVWLNGDWNLNTIGQDPKNPAWWAWTEAANSGNPPVVGQSTVVAIADYPYGRGDQAMVSDQIQKSWTWGEQKFVDVLQLGPIQGSGDNARKMVDVWLSDRDAMPAVGETVVFQLSSNGAVITDTVDSVYDPVSGTMVNVIDPVVPQSKLVAVTSRYPTAEEVAKFDVVHGYPAGTPIPYAIASVIIVGGYPTTVQTALDIAIYEPEGVLSHHETLRFDTPSIADPELAPGVNHGVYTGIALPVAQATGSIADKLVAIWWQDNAGAWHAYQPGAPKWANDLSDLVPGNVYYINVSGSCDWVLVGGS